MASAASLINSLKQSSSSSSAPSLSSSSGAGKKSAGGDDGTSIVHVAPLHFVHVLDVNTNITGLVTGPTTLVLQTHEELVYGPERFIVIPPGRYCVLENPVDLFTVQFLSKSGARLTSVPSAIKGSVITSRQAPFKVSLGVRTVRFHGEPFPLFPGEEIIEGITKGIKPLPIVPVNQAIHLRALFDFDDTVVVDGAETTLRRHAGDEWQLSGPLTYHPRGEVQVVGMVQPRIIKEGTALRLRARRDCVDNTGRKRVTGEEWLVKTRGAYVVNVDEEFVAEVSAVTLTETTGLHLIANETFVDFKGVRRHAGDEWLVTLADTESYIPDVKEKITKIVSKIVLGPLDYCIVLNPFNSKTGKPQLGQKEVRHGVSSFFLHPGESLTKEGVTQAYVLATDEAIVISAIESFVDTESVSAKDGKAKTRLPGERWMVHGPKEYIPRIEVAVIARRKAIALDLNEGIYVQDLQSGSVRAVMGPITYLLQAYEQLWSKEMSAEVEELLANGGGKGDEDVRKIAYFEGGVLSSKPRDKTRVVTFRIPHNTAVQLHDYEKKTCRVLFGPELALLGPHENFTVFRLSAGKPKRPEALRTIALMLGPDFTTDIISVETADHARLILTIAFNNYFRFDRANPATWDKLFCIPDFIGFACKNIGSRIRERVAQTTFDEFHKYSARIIMESVFGKRDDGSINSELVFDYNGLVVTNVDVQSIEPSDQQMRDSLQKSVQMAIEIATRSIEASSRHEAEHMEQAARGALEKQKILNEIEAEKAQCRLAEIRAFNSAIESTGHAKAEAVAQAERVAIEAQAAIIGAKLQAEAQKLESDAELETLTKARNAELQFILHQNQLDIAKKRALAEIEKNKLKRTVNSLGHGTLLAMASSEGENKIRLLKALNLKSTIFTDGNSPMNLFNTANGLLGKN